RTHIRNRIEAALQHDFLNGSIVNAAMVNNGRETGAQLSYSRPDMYGTTHVETGYSIPFWDLLSSLEGNGVRDRITAGRMQQISQRITAKSAACVLLYPGPEGRYLEGRTHAADFAKNNSAIPCVIKSLSHGQSGSGAHLWRQCRR